MYIEVYLLDYRFQIVFGINRNFTKVVEDYQ